MQHSIPLYILTMAAVTYAIRVLPLTLIRRQITNRFLRSFLYYVPYVTLSVMTFPAILSVTSSPLAGLAAFLCGIVAARKGAKLIYVCILCCLAVLCCEAVPLLL